MIPHLTNPLPENPAWSSGGPKSTLLEAYVGPAGAQYLPPVPRPVDFTYAQLRDNNSIIGMLDSADEDYRYFLELYAPGFGNDETIFIAFHHNDSIHHHPQ